MMSHYVPERRQLLVVALFVLGATLAACSSGSTVLSPAAKAPVGFTGFASARGSVCVQPTATAQSVALPATGGVSGTMSFGAFAAAANGCDEVQIATGADVVSADIRRQAAGRVRLASSADASTPILTISVGAAQGVTPIFGYETIVTGIKLDAPSLPDGTYYALLMPLGDYPVLTFKAVGGILTLQPLAVPPGEPPAPVVIAANTSMTFAIFPMGVIPVVASPTPSPSPAPTPTPSGSPSATPTPKPTSSPSATPAASPTPNQSGFYGNPPPTDGPNIGTYSFTDPSSTSCQPGQLLCNGSNIPIEQANGAGQLFIPTDFYGTISYQADIAYMGLYPPVTNTCASDWTVTAALDGSGTISIPSTDFLYEFPTQPQCTITYTTIPPNPAPGSKGGYEEVIELDGVDGVPCSNGVCTGIAPRRRRP